MKKEGRIIQVGDVSIGGNIRLQRERMGLKQTEMVARLQLLGCDISVYSYNRIEKGSQNPTVSQLLALCQIFSCDINCLFGMKSVL